MRLVSRIGEYASVALIVAALSSCSNETDAPLKVSLLSVDGFTIANISNNSDRDICIPSRELDISNGSILLTDKSGKVLQSNKVDFDSKVFSSGPFYFVRRRSNVEAVVNSDTIDIRPGAYEYEFALSVLDCAGLSKSRFTQLDPKDLNYFKGRVIYKGQY